MGEQLQDTEEWVSRKIVKAEDLGDILLLLFENGDYAKIVSDGEVYERAQIITYQKLYLYEQVTLGLITQAESDEIKETARVEAIKEKEKYLLDSDKATYDRLKIRFGDT